MSDMLRDRVTPLLAPRVVLDQMLTPAEMAEHIENFEVTSEGSLRTVRGPAPWLSKLGVAGAYYTHTYIHGLHHCRLSDGQRDVLLVHDGKNLLEFDGSNQTWTKVISAAGGLFPASLPDLRTPHAPTRFVTTPTGVIILPAGGLQRAYFYDGFTAGYLGYYRAPSPPMGAGPLATSSNGSSLDYVANFKGYAIDYAQMNTTRAVSGPLVLFPRAHFGRGRIGTTDSDPVADSRGRLMPGKWVARSQFIDVWGNLSPLSGPSAPVVLEQEIGGVTLDAEMEVASAIPVDWLTKQFSWAAVATGPENTVGRLIYRSKDLEHNPGGEYLLQAGYGGSGLSAFASIPDNVSQRFQDNIPDALLVHKAEEVLPLPRAVAIEVAFGRCWFADTLGGLAFSETGRYGTVMEGNVIYPDAKGGVVRSLVAVPGGLLAIADRATFLIVPDENGGFKAATLNATIGTQSPDSPRVMAGGLCVWFDGRRFVYFDPSTGAVERAPNQPQRRLDLVDRSRSVSAAAMVHPKTGEYHCWLTAAGGEDNTFGFTFDGEGWRFRTAEQVRSAAVMEGGEQYVLFAGTQKNSAAGTMEYVWVLDRQIPYWVPAETSGLFRTSWLNAGDLSKVSPLHLNLLIRETSETHTLKVKVYRDWDNSAGAEITSTEIDLARRLTSSEVPRAWGTATLGASSMKARRPVWVRVAIAAPSCDSFQIELESAGGLFEVYGFVVSETERRESRRIQRGQS
jgi:hypothetical protein